jgi:hypothetical protein
MTKKTPRARYTLEFKQVQASGRNVSMTRIAVGQHEVGTAATVTCRRCRLTPFSAFAQFSGFA